MLPLRQFLPAPRRPRFAPPLAACLAALGLPGTAPAQSSAPDTGHGAPGSVIFLHPDGMGVNSWGVARMLLAGPDGRLEWDHLPHMAVYTGHMTDQLGSTSHGGATTHAFGVKVRADSYGMDGPDALVAASGRPLGLVSEAREAGLATGLVNSGTITEPGTGAFVASVPERRRHAEIAARILASGVDVILGGGERWFLPAGAPGVHGEGRRADGRDLLAEARAAGYAVVRTREELLALPDTVTRLLGLFAANHTFHDLPEEELAAVGLAPYDPAAPTFAEMVGTALEVLARSGRRFLLVAEEEGTDNHANATNAAGTLEAARRADEAVGVAREFVRAHPRTLVLLTSDSDAGGMQVYEKGVREGDPVPATTRIGAPLDGAAGTASEPFLSAPDARGRRHPFAVAWVSSGDLSGGILVRAAGHGAHRVRGTMDNTDVYRVMYRTLFGPLPGDD
ncbi:MAG: alkaline phosphatase [Gemmatimonadota bacterium]|nr:alkaline phosphatase [Gemmatimonadota bacterium]